MLGCRRLSNVNGRCRGWEPWPFDNIGGAQPGTSPVGPTEKVEGSISDFGRRAKGGGRRRSVCGSSTGCDQPEQGSGVSISTWVDIAWKSKARLVEGVTGESSDAAEVQPEMVSTGDCLGVKVGECGEVDGWEPDAERDVRSRVLLRNDAGTKSAELLLTISGAAVLTRWPARAFCLAQTKRTPGRARGT